LTRITNFSTFSIFFITAFWFVSILIISSFCFYITIFIIISGSLFCFIARLKLAHRRTERGRGGSTASAPVELEYVPAAQAAHADAPVKRKQRVLILFYDLLLDRN
jgi:hypothetical protein